MGRPRFSQAQREQILQREDNPHGAEHCWHCGVSLKSKPFDVDHYPVRFADIEGQICCGVVDPRDEANLVPSCRNCNRSHKHEITSWCGRSQIRCTFGCTISVVFLTVMGAVTGALISWKYLA